MSQDNAPPAPAAEQGSRNLIQRIAAALVLAPGAIAIAWLGGWPWAVLATLVAIGLFVEWLGIVGAARDFRVLVLGCLCLIVCGLGLAFGKPAPALVAAVLGVGGLTLLGDQPRRWTATGLGYAAAALIASILVRLDPDHGFAALVLVLLVVWGADIGGYFAGRTIGGPKLWPRVSPKKTWAGAIGGLVLSLVVGLGFGLAGFGKVVPLLVLAAVLSTASQLGDLLESAVKRRFGVKDSSHIIPGHGGLMDRLDGYVTAVVVAVLIGLTRAPLDGIGGGLMVW
ncbi:phosphatidate cytidylyltransferase [Rhodopseudomonas thermotolerans]|uniref:Phosphatidate cytidylyltransferase n=2 Tax=Rhodopseudomonas TaxID=1073 RepID=A0A336JGS4_9BRAD|nr:MULTISPECIES: phosphatidate cytidylyltransferase [Rhodopseudomonas]RED42349.1 phosphatidate cytidylyltransferase [Rhodopseudomonas pentothenatexigens]REG08139.1 phosphatidate cytidylyltransferase [Rhodopseudomonas thermotolerans]SSW88950.1 phosphatidate cytidylyltransferase [Rhodopseudomonas pentothenatexigens]